MKTTSKLEIRSKKNKKTGIMEVSIYADKVKISTSFILEGDILQLRDIAEPIVLQNGFAISATLNLHNISQ